MMKILLICLFAFTVSVQDKKVERLKDVKTVYVDSLGDSDGAKLIREKLINRLVLSKRLTVTESKEEADALIIGIGDITQGQSGSIHGNQSTVSGSTRTTYDATLVVRLITPQRKILWVNEAKPGRWFVGSASSDVAKKIVESLIKDIEKDNKKKP